MSEVKKVRHANPLLLKKQTQNINENPNHNLHNNMLFIISTTPMLIPILKLANKTQPRALIVLPEHDQTDSLDLRDSYWKDLKKIDGIPAQEFYKRCNEKAKYVDQNQSEDEKESVKMKYSHDRFMFTKSYSLSSSLNEKTLTEFITQVSKNKLKPYFESEIPVPIKYAERVVGEDFKKKILKSKHDCVLLLENPVEKENRGYKEKYERYAKKNESGDIKYYTMKSFNETDVFKAKT